MAVMNEWDRVWTGQLEHIGGMGWCDGCRDWKKVTTVAWNHDGKSPELADEPDTTRCIPCLKEAGL